MKINPRLLKSHRFLSLLPSATLRKVANGEGMQDYPKGSIIFTQGEPSGAMYLIVSGRCESRHVDAGGHLITEIHGPGETLGDREVINRGPYLSTVIVVTESVLLRVPARDVREVFDAEPKVAGRISQSIIRRIVERRNPSTSRRIVALHALSTRIPERLLGRRLADALGGITGQSVLSLHFSPQAGCISLASWGGDLMLLDGASPFSREVRELHPGCFELDVRTGAEPAEAGYVAPLLSHLGSHYDHILIDAGKDTPPPVLLECLIQSDLTYILMRPDTESLHSMKLLMGELESRPGGTYRHISPVVCTDGCQTAVRFSEDCAKAGWPVHSVLTGFPPTGLAGSLDRSPAVGAQLRRMAREIGRCRVGLALSSGGARGLAHIGVIQVLEENGIEIDAVAGSSMGAYVGAVWTYGHDGAACEKIARDLERRWGLLYLVDPVLPPRQGFLRTRRIGRRLRRAIGTTRFLELVRPLRVVATDFETLDRVVFSSGEVAEAVEASIAVPGICVPVKLRNQLLMDGGIADPLPVDVLSEMGIERIIAVNTLPTSAHLAMCSECEYEPKNRRRGLGAYLNKHLNYFARGNLCDILLRAGFGAQMRVAEQSAHIADIVLRPWTCDARWHDFTNPGKYIALGRKAAEEQLAEIKKLNQNYEIPTAALALAG